MKIQQLREILWKHTQNSNIIGNWFQVFPHTVDLDQDNIDEIRTDEPVLDKDDSINKHCNDGSIDIPDFRPKFNLNPLAKEFIYLGQGLDLNVTHLNEDIYNPGTSEYLLYLVKNLK
ncbi:uncharacterized protein LOC132917632 [Rhopalosiphum padi]|uniref:uncharacterized protein LOC132917632 n=1 Tax=Rhopalosiphum padi TaxID=40932 RepID=UPI00298D8BF4|nr:uncharacterized protein LOC132917632 [Rhopalosiphum padi]